MSNLQRPSVTVGKEEVQRESFSTIMHVPGALEEIYIDPFDKFDYNTQSTVGISVEFFVTYSCSESPKVDKVKVRGFNQVGFFISSEYEVEAYVDDSKVVAVSKEGCEKAFLYEISVQFFVYLLIGLGFGLGGGTGTLGWKSKSSQEVQTFSTHVMCCDPVRP